MSCTIVLVHGAFAESVSWDGVIDPLVAEGHRVVAAANPLRGLATDAAAVSDLVRTIQGPVVLVAHSYGGAVIRTLQLRRRRDRRTRLRPTGSPRSPVRTASSSRPCSRAACSARRRHGRSRGATERPTSTSLRAASTTSSARTSPRRRPSLMAATQRPATQEALVEASGERSLWKDVPSWFLIGEHDRIIPAALQHFMAQARRRAIRTIEIPGASHALGVSQPGGDGSPDPRGRSNVRGRVDLEQRPRETHHVRNDHVHASRARARLAGFC